EATSIMQREEYKLRTAVAVLFFAPILAGLSLCCFSAKYSRCLPLGGRPGSRRPPSQSRQHSRRSDGNESRQMDAHTLAAASSVRRRPRILDHTVLYVRSLLHRRSHFGCVSVRPVGGESGNAPRPVCRERRECLWVFAGLRSAGLRRSECPAF